MPVASDRDWWQVVVNTVVDASYIGQGLVTGCCEYSSGCQLHRTGLVTGCCEYSSGYQFASKIGNFLARWANVSLWRRPWCYKFLLQGSMVVVVHTAMQIHHEQFFERRGWHSATLCTLHCCYGVICFNRINSDAYKWMPLTEWLLVLKHVCNVFQITFSYSRYSRDEMNVVKIDGFNKRIDPTR